MDSTPGQLIRASLLELLRAGAGTIAVAGRVPRVIETLPQSRFAQREMPAIWVENPALQTDTRSGAYRVKTYECRIWVFDAATSSSGVGRLAAVDRINLLTERVVAYLQSVSPNWNLAYLLLFASAVTWAVGEAMTDFGGKGMMASPVAATVVVQAEE